MAARRASISPSAGRVVSKEARAMKPAIHSRSAHCSGGCADLVRTCAARTWVVMVSALSLAAPSGDDVGFVEEPQAAVPAPRVGGGIEMRAVVDAGGKPVVFDLGHVDRGVPGGKQSRGADRIR